MPRAPPMSELESGAAGSAPIAANAALASGRSIYARWWGFAKCGDRYARKNRERSSLVGSGLTRLLGLRRPLLPNGANAHWSLKDSWVWTWERIAAFRLRSVAGQG